MVNDPPGAPPATPTTTTLLSISQLREKLTAFGVRYDHCIEKTELVKLLKRAEFMAGRVEFIATDAWQSVESFHLCPIGLQYEMDMKTGHTFAKLSEKVRDGRTGNSTPMTPGAKPRTLAAAPSPCKLNLGAERTSSSNATSGSHASGARTSMSSKPLTAARGQTTAPSTPLRLNAMPSRPSLSSGDRLFIQKDASQCEPDLTQRKPLVSDAASRAYPSRSLAQAGETAEPKLSTTLEPSGGALTAQRRRAEQQQQEQQQQQQQQQQRRMSGASLFEKLPFETKEAKGPRWQDDRRRSHASSAHQHRSDLRSERDKKPSATGTGAVKGDATRSKKSSHNEASRKRRRDSLAESTVDEGPVLTPLCPEPMLVLQCEPQLARRRKLERPPKVEKELVPKVLEQDRDKEHKQRHAVRARERERQREQQRATRERERQREKRRRKAKEGDARTTARERSAPRAANADQSAAREVQTEQAETLSTQGNGAHSMGKVEILASSDATERCPSTYPLHSFV